MIAPEKYLTLSEAAAAKVKEFLAKESKQLAGLRLYVAGGGCSGLTYGMALEENPTADDFVVEENGVKIFVDPLSARYLKGVQIDYVDTLQGSGFKITNPNAISTCACGQSFHTS